MKWNDTHSDRSGPIRRSKSAVDDVWGGVASTIELDPHVLGADAAAGLDQFSHIDVIFHFHLVPAAEVETGARHPRNRSDWPLAGILAQRAKRRPNRLGVISPAGW